MLALVPGVSRSGITMTAGRGAGLDRVSAARFSFLLATPITFGAGLLELRHLPHDLPVGTLAIGVAVSAITGLLAIRGLLLWLGRAGFAWFFAYRAALADGLVAAGMAPDTPSAVVSRGTLPDQRTVTAPLAALATAAEGLPGPALVVVGDVVSLRARIASSSGAAMPARARA